MILPAESTLAAEGLEELQMAIEVTSSLVLSLNVPVAVNCRLPLPTASVAPLGVIAIEVSARAVRFVEPVTDPDLALMVAVPAAVTVTTPAVLTVAT